MLRTASRSAFRRTLASHVKPQLTELSNGLRVATSTNDQAGAATVGIVFGSGSTAENPYNNGVSSIISNLVKSEGALPAAKLGAQISTSVSRESQSFLASFSGAAGLNKSLDLLQSQISIASGSGPDGAISGAIQKSIQQAEQFELNDHAGRVMEHLHATAFQNTPLALPVRGTVEALQDLEKIDIENFAKSHFRNSNAVIVGSGNISHEELVKAVESQLSLHSGEKPELKKKSSFLGSEVRLRDDTLPKAWIAIAAEGESVTSPNYHVAQVAAEVFGSFNAHEPSSKIQGIKLLDEIQEYHLVDTYDHFSHSYKDSGLWGFAAEISNIGQIDDLTHFTLKQWNRLTISVTEQEVARAKSLLKLKLGSTSLSNVSTANSLGANTLALGSSPDLAQVFEKIDAITVSDVKSWASSRLWDQDIAIAGTGQIEDLLDYMRLRNDMSMMRW